MELGAFSISLAVKDIEASRAFYEKLASRSSEATLAQLADPEERRSRDRSVSRDVREEHLDLQSGLGQQRKKLDTFTDVRDHSAS